MLKGISVIFVTLVIVVSLTIAAHHCNRHKFSSGMFPDEQRKLTIPEGQEPFVLIPAGKVEMEVKEGKHKLNLSYSVESFEVGRYLVTIDEFLQFVQNSDSENGELFYDTGLSGTNRPGTDLPDPSLIHDRALFADKGLSDLPITNVTWVGAMAYCEWLSDETYEYRLPWECEWEYMASNGGTTKYPWGNQKSIAGVTSRPTNYMGTYLIFLPVGSLPANANKWGVYDLVGSADQWCLDEWTGTDTRNPPSSSIPEPKTPADTQSYDDIVERITKGGMNVPNAAPWWSFSGGTSRLPSAFSRWSLPERYFGGGRLVTGFRVIREKRKSKDGEAETATKSDSE